MRRILFTTFVLIWIVPIFSQKNTDQFTTIDQTINALYNVISGDKGVERDWELFNSLFYDNARLIASGTNKSGIVGARFLTPQDYINTSGKWLIENGFHEIEIHREIQQFGNIAQVFSTYEAKHSTTDDKPFMRGINSIQLLNDGTRWWVVNIYWSQESKENPIPKEYLPD